MKTHSMVFDDFFDDPRRAKALIDMQEMKDELYADGVTYPNIIRLPESIQDEISQKMQFIVGPAFREVLSFGRYSFENTEPPHWAHSDHNIAGYLGLIYLSHPPSTDRGVGTYLLRHKAFEFETHPAHEFYKEILLGGANHKDEWEITFECPGRYNRIFLLNSEFIHAAGDAYGTDKDDGRLVLSVFFNLVNA